MGSLPGEELGVSRRDFLRGAVASGAYLAYAPWRVLEGAAVRAKRLPGKSEGSATLMARAADTFLESLAAGQRARALLDFGDDRRLDWNFRPRLGEDFRSKETEEWRRSFLSGLPYPRGIALRDLDPEQRRLAEDLMRTGLSSQGLGKVKGIFSLAPILMEMDQGYPVWEADRFSFALFRRKGSKGPWAWAMEGHHLSFNYTIVDGDAIASTPSFMGAVPAEVPFGDAKGKRVLAAEEDMARSFVQSLDTREREKAVINPAPPKEILSGVKRKMEALMPAGIRAAVLSQQQAEMLSGLVRLYAENMPSDIASERLGRIRAAGFGNIYFAWCGSIERGQPHYYRIQGPSFLIEYDNVQNNGNHIHTVWRDFERDFGEDLLVRHYRESHGMG